VETGVLELQLLAKKRLRLRVTYVADGLDLSGALEGNVEREGLDSTTLALEVLIVEEHILQMPRHDVSVCSKV
jgi:hypothetical protein